MQSRDTSCKQQPDAMRYTQKTLERFENLICEAGYILRYEKGNFRPGYCILHDKKVIVVNKFFDVEGRINSLNEILDQLQIEPDKMSPEAQAFYGEVRSASLKKA